MHENFNEFLEIKGSSDKSFCLVFSCFFTIIGLYPLLKTGSPHFWALGMGCGFLILGYTFPKLVSPLNHLWTKFGIFLGKIFTPIIMAIIYFSIFLLIGVILKICRKDLLRLRPDKSRKTYWLTRENKVFSPDSLKNQF